MVSYLHFGKKPITSNYLIEQADFVGCHHENYIKKYDIVNSVKKNGTFVLNTKRTNLHELEEYLPGSVKKMIAEKNVDFYAIDAHGLAEKLGMGNHVNWILSTVFFKLSKVRISYSSFLFLFSLHSLTLLCFISCYFMSFVILI